MDMALKDQPYIPLYVNDFLGNEKLRECSASSVGVYIMLLCFLHKCDPYGIILPKQNGWQTGWQNNNSAIPDDKDFAMKFAQKLSKHLPFSAEEIKCALNELNEHDVIQMDANQLSQKRMIKDNNLSIQRAQSGKKGAKKKWKK